MLAGSRVTSAPDVAMVSRRRLFAGIAALSTAGGGLLAMRSAQAAYHRGPATDHFDGLRFFDPHGVPPRSFFDLARWVAARRNLNGWPAWAPSPYSDRPPARVEGAAWRISYVGHASLLLQTAGRNILIDPVWSERV